MQIHTNKKPLTFWYNSSTIEFPCSPAWGPWQTPWTFGFQLRPLWKNLFRIQDTLQHLDTKNIFFLSLYNSYICEYESIFLFLRNQSSLLRLTSSGVLFEWLCLYRKYLLPFLNNEKQFERGESAARAAGRKGRNKGESTLPSIPSILRIIACLSSTHSSKVRLWCQ